MDQNPYAPPNAELELFHNNILYNQIPWEIKNGNAILSNFLNTIKFFRSTNNIRSVLSQNNNFLSAIRFLLIFGCLVFSFIPIAIYFNGIARNKETFKIDKIAMNLANSELLFAQFNNIFIFPALIFFISTISGIINFIINKFFNSYSLKNFIIISYYNAGIFCLPLGLIGIIMIITNIFLNISASNNNLLIVIWSFIGFLGIIRNNYYIFKSFKFSIFLTYLFSFLSFIVLIIISLTPFSIMFFIKS